MVTDALPLLALVVAGIPWSALADSTVRVAVVTTAAATLWRYVAAPLIFRPIGRQLAKGARSEAEAVVAELVEPRIAELRTAHDHLAAGQERLSDRLDRVLLVLDRPGHSE